MKYFFVAIALFSASLCFSQTDQHGNPVFNSIPTGEDSINGIRLLSNYYPLKDNIDNKTTSVYISDKPSLEEIAGAATSLPSDYFILLRSQAVIKMILVRNSPDRRFLVVTPGAEAPKLYKHSLKGDIYENRAKELLRSGYDPAASINGDRLSFNGKIYSIISNEALKTAVLQLISREHLDTAGGGQVKMLSKEELRAYILRETKEGGEMDFFTPIKGKEYNGVTIKPGVIATLIEIALYKWGRGCFDKGVGSSDEALAIFADFKGRALNIREQTCIKDGFEKSWEK